MPTRKADPRGKKPYRVFVSHSGDDIWVAEQIARLIEDCGADAFLDRRDIAAGDDFRERIRKRFRNAMSCLRSSPLGLAREPGCGMRSGWQMF
ncbi:toll/interleukin-1 receptor domain-containing protein [Roseiarcus sp.]|uniref:toll/interleukin-1 receptor domain-containing protein n=1 Tax=Roseiarcus sp. TaxID=1969460 RepID=UPI003C74C030